ncbi:extracellular solute-binding protein family 1 [Xylanimonas cellulosilytica DSM 15894]|uniref:Extracellular solute-binding protein family 1 n=1 Tax=Xylanimonas cellulosilytica (strain DSM 15894 / JCM 12276 / CECT 5975 / KCTC 9989 / LMG 20990 / NBRC 107835 / XIL07) TaxID=446471 RepID=D1BWY4_XYLCX|nr:extracellular solute-binding protein [Xylanimonas cellulosilytica]ACZ31552.1 extracellular solute-binding protein family 1 [Xylanimonas cellulosilytica DSM 15894]
MPTSLDRRAARAGTAAIAAIVVAGLTGCAATSNADTGTTAAPAATDDGGGSGEKVTIKFSWWGSDSRVASTQAIIDAFEAENPDIHVEPVSTTWDDYFETMNVMAAGNDTPDVMTQDDRYLTEYASRGLLADLGSLDVDTSHVDPSVVETGVIDGNLYGIATGINVHAVVANPAAFEAAGVALPDDTTWTWEDYSEIAAQVSAGSDGAVTGVQNYSFIEPVLAIYARQHGEELFTPDGAIGVSPQTIESWFQRSVDQIAAKAEPSASTSTEVQGAGVDGSLVATGKGAMAWFWSNQLGAIEKTAGHPLTLLRAPGDTQFERTGEYFRAAMYYSISAKSAHPEEAARFVDFMLNSQTAGDINLTDRGLPSNLEVREAVLPKLSEADKTSAAFIQALTDDDVVADSKPVPPKGSGEVSDITGRINSDVIFGKITPADAATRWIDEVTKAIGR